MAEDNESFGDMLGLDGEAEVATEAPKGADVTSLASEVGELRGRMSSIDSSLNDLKTALVNMNPNNQKTVDKVVDAGDDLKAKYDKLIAAGVKPGEIEAVKEIIDYAVGNKLKEVDAIQSKLNSFNQQFDTVSRTAGATAFTTALNQLTVDPALNNADSILTFNEWKNEELMPVLNSGKLDPAIAQALLTDPVGTMRFLYLKDVGMASIDPSKVSRIKEARQAAAKKKEGASIPKGQGTAAKNPEATVQPQNISDRVHQGLLKSFRV